MEGERVLRFVHTSILNTYLSPFELELIFVGDIGAGDIVPSPAGIKWPSPTRLA